MATRDIIAENLENRGLYRRAATRWLEVMDECKDSTERLWVAQRRNQCFMKSRQPGSSLSTLGGYILRPS
ncbi:PerC family transcriptional regulator [Salmonella enterica subsp. enterica serovar Hvittingfoss]|nr:PerC family transcriptional regulator [Salmonella enterica subsp. enterica serovar Hvittingfoss]EHL2848706.1 PerC family transcriptional regulator [Salmonella enterica subsp. enterica serovar Hvittingfoss]